MVETIIGFGANLDIEGVAGTPLQLATKLGFHAVDEVHVGRHLVIEVKAADAKAAEASVREMCTRLLANPVTEDFEVEAVRAAAAA